MLALLWGERKGLSRSSPLRPMDFPATDYILLVSIDSSFVIGGSIDGKQLAISVFPQPGLPMRMILGIYIPPLSESH